LRAVAVRIVGGGWGAHGGMALAGRGGSVGDERGGWGWAIPGLRGATGEAAVGVGADDSWARDSGRLALPAGHRLAGKRQALPGASGGTLGGIVAARGYVGRRDGWGGGLGVLAADWVVGEREALAGATGDLVGARVDEGPRDGRCRRLGVPAAHRVAGERGAQVGALSGNVAARGDVGRHHLGRFMEDWSTSGRGFLARLVVGEWFGIGFAGREVMV
jgi:hypothetical protein